MTFESQNLPKIPDIPGEFTLAQREFFTTLKEVLEVMLGRRGDQPLTPQFEIGTYEGDGIPGDRLIAVSFRPRYVRLFPRYDNTDTEWLIERIDLDGVVNWETYSFWHDTTATDEHKHYQDLGITAIDDNGFYVNNDGSDQVPNKIGDNYDWVAFG